MAKQNFKESTDTPPSQEEEKNQKTGSEDLPGQDQEDAKGEQEQRSEQPEEDLQKGEEEDKDDKEDPEPTNEPRWLKSRLDRAREAGAKEKEKEMSDRIVKLEKRIDDLIEKDLSLTREKIALELGVPAKYASGNTEKEMRENAEAFLEDSKSVLKQKPRGYVPNQGTAKTNEGVSPFDVGRSRAQDRFNKDEVHSTQ